MSTVGPASNRRGTPDTDRLTWVTRAAAFAGVVVVAWVFLSAWGAVVHGHPLYAVLLAATLLGSALLAWRTLRPLPRSTGWRRVARAVLIAAWLGWIALLGWLRPFVAVEPAVSALRSDAGVVVAETATRITLTPTEPASATGLFFQPGARVDARAYAAVLRPVAEAGHTVVIAKQPLGIAFLSLGAFDAVWPDHPGTIRWVIGGHSLGGTVAAITADAAGADPEAPVVGLLLYASYPASDLSTSLRAEVLSLSGGNDGLATPAKIEASRATLPAESTFVSLEGVAHSSFGDYGPQPGDGTPTVRQDDARAQIAGLSVEFVDELSR